MNGGTDFVRPDPAKGQLGDAAYAQHWKAAHQGTADTFDYHSDYLDLLVLDALLKEGYSLLDVGCGTAGYHRLIKRHGSVHGIDVMPEMIEAAEEFKATFGLRDARYTCGRFEDLDSGARYDAIRMPGIYGWYRPWHGQMAILHDLRKKLNSGGTVVVSYVPPATIAQWAKTMLAPHRTVVIPRERFLSMAGKAGFSLEFEIRRRHSVVAFLRAAAS